MIGEVIFMSTRNHDNNLEQQSKSKRVAECLSKGSSRRQRKVMVDERPA